MSSKQNDSIAFRVKLISKETKQRGDKYLPITRQDFPELIQLQGQWNDRQGDLYDYSIELTDHYFWFSALKGRGRPRNPMLIDTSNEKKIENPRTVDLVEPTEPFFALILFSEDTRQESLFVYPDGVRVIKDFLSTISPEHLGKLYVKSCILPKDKLLAKFKMVEEINLAENAKSATLFTHTQGFPNVRKTLNDFTGIDAPTTCRLTIRAVYQAHEIMPFLSKIFDGRMCRAYSSLSIKGRDEDGLDVIFNKDTISKKIEIPAETNQNGIYDSEEIERIKKALLEKVYGPQN